MEASHDQGKWDIYFFLMSLCWYQTAIQCHSYIILILFYLLNYNKIYLLKFWTNSVDSQYCWRSAIKEKVNGTVKLSVFQAVRNKEVLKTRGVPSAKQTEAPAETHDTQQSHVWGLVDQGSCKESGPPRGAGRSQAVFPYQEEVAKNKHCSAVTSTIY